MHEDVREALLQFEEACTESGHRFCDGQLTCLKGLEAVGRWQGEHMAATGFDVGRKLLERRGEMPSHEWATPTLLAHAADQLRRQPNVNSLWRATSITTALARLGERGLPVDCMVRTCMGPELLRHIIIISANIWCDIANGSRLRQCVPELEGWLKAVEEDPAIRSLGSSDRGRVVLRSLQGVPRERGEAWLREAALAHVLSWRLDDYVKSEARPDELVLRCGHAGTRWVFERFTKTYPDEWSNDSRSWEAAFRVDPGAVAESTGVPLSVLHERTVTEEQLNSSILHSVTRGAPSPKVDGVGVDEIVEIALVQLEEGLLEGARQLADKASRHIPQDGSLRRLRAFSHLPVEPSVSRGVWQDMIDAGGVDGDEMHILRADIATAHLMEGRIGLATKEIAKIPRSGTSIDAWLWDPMSLPDEPRVCYASMEAWLRRFDAAISR